MMSKVNHGRGSKYTDDFKRKLVAQSSADGVSVPMVAKKHGVGTNRIYAWEVILAFSLMIQMLRLSPLLRFPMRI